MDVCFCLLRRCAQVREGIDEHPMLERVHTDQHEEADYIFYISIRGDEMEKEEGKACPGPFPDRTIVLDETDTPDHIAVDGRWFVDGDR